jgi:hypothetical protein
MVSSDLHLLRSLDPADRALSQVQQARAAARLEQILTTPVGPVPARGAAGPGRARRRLPRRLALAAVGAVGLLGLGVLVPRLGGAPMAYASWTATPAQVAQHDAAAAIAACREGHARRHDGPLAWDPMTIPVLLTERRGEVVGVLLHQDGPHEVSATCLATVPPGTGEVVALDGATSGSTGLGIPAQPGQIRVGGLTEYAGGVLVTDGPVGSGVVGVTIHAGEHTVTASVAGGRYAAWGPGTAFAPSAGPNGAGGPRPILRYDVTLADGTVLRDVRPPG